jgi:RluA family pseudouridine synthase
MPGLVQSQSVIKLASPATGEFLEIPMVYEHDHLLAVNKPSGLLSSPDRYDPERPNLMKLLHAAIAEGKPWAKQRGLDYLMNAHCLDFETSGVMLLARSKPVLVTLANLFGSEKPVKRYVALAQGASSEERFEVNAALAPHPVRIGEFRVDTKRGKRARTRFEVLEQFAGWTLLRCEPLTERTHQIRVHLRRAGLPIVGDELYGGKPLLLSRLKSGYHLKPGHTERPLLNRVALHAEELTLPHPVGNETVKIVASWPKDLTVAVKYLRRFAAMGQAASQPDNLP